jgi:hypothetical protein
VNDHEQTWMESLPPRGSGWVRSVKDQWPTQTKYPPATARWY